MEEICSKTQYVEENIQQNREDTLNIRCEIHTRHLRERAKERCEGLLRFREAFLEQYTARAKGRRLLGGKK
jgi:hypothetical protein